MRALALVAVLSCTPRHGSLPSNVPDAGISIAVYDRGGDGAYGVVDDRRWVELTGKELVIEHVDPGADLASLVIEPLGAAFRVGQCNRSQLPTAAPEAVELHIGTNDEARAAERHAELQRRMQLRHGGVRVTTPPPDPHAEAATHFDVTVRCAIDATPGRYLIRILYVSPSLRYRAQHDIDVGAADHATITTRFAIATPRWNERADVSVFDGIPGGDQLPREVARGTALLDGSIAVVSVPTRQVPARVRRVYDGAVPTPGLPAADASWNSESIQSVWVWLELPNVHLAPGPVRVHLELPGEGIGDVDIAQTARQQADRPDAPLRLPLWTDDALRGTRQRVGDLGDGAQLAERFLLSVANLGETPREVWVEEHVRPARKRRVERAWPGKPAASGELLRSKLEIQPHRIERVGYTIAYEF